MNIPFGEEEYLFQFLEGDTDYRLRFILTPTAVPISTTKLTAAYQKPMSPQTIS